jgi:hypothetical protein
VVGRDLTDWRYHFQTSPVKAHTMSGNCDTPTNSDPSVLVRECALANRWGKSVRTLQRWRAERYGPAYMRIGGSVFYRSGDILAFEEQMRCGGEKRK